MIYSHLNMIYSQGCIPTIAHPTRITSTSLTLIDHIYTNNFIKEMKSFILLHDLTDHFPILVSTKFRKLDLTPDEILIRDTKHFNIEKFNQELQNNLLNIRNYDTFNASYLMSTFIGTFSDTLNVHAPLHKQTRKEKKLKMKPWLTKGTLKSIKCKNQVYVKCLKEQNSEQWKYYKKFRNKLTHIKELAKKSYFQDKISKNKPNTSKLWQAINNIIHRKGRKSNQVPKEIHVKDEIIQNSKNVNNAFNEYFVS